MHLFSFRTQASDASKMHRIAPSKVTDFILQIYCLLASQEIPQFPLSANMGYRASKKYVTGIRMRHKFMS